MRKLIVNCLCCGNLVSSSVYASFCSVYCKIKFVPNEPKKKPTVFVDPDFKRKCELKAARRREALQRKLSKKKEKRKQKKFDSLSLSQAKATIIELRNALGRVNSKRSKGNDFYKSEAWREVRYRVLKRHGRICALCKVTDSVFHVDHIKPRSKFPDLELNESNLQVLCADCNLGKSNKDDTDWREDFI